MYYISVPPTMGLINSTIAHDEHIECTNATIIVKNNGEFSGWINNEKMMTIAIKEDDNI